MMTKIREGYKETEIGVIPEDWDVSKLSQILQNRSEKYTPNEDEDFPYVALEHIDQESGKLIGIGKSSESTSTKSAFYKNDVLFGKLRPYLRKYWLSDIDGVCSTEILALKALTHPEFAFYTIQSNKFIEDISKKAFGTKMPRTSWADMKDYKIPLPPLPEQQRIAEILSTTDSHIEKLDKTIEDYQLLKKGMMKKLLTEGIGHTEFKETEIGRIPKEWEVVSLGNIFTLASGEGLSQKDIIGGNYPVYGGNGINGYHNSYLFDSSMITIGRVGAKCGCIHYTQPKAWITDNALFIKNRKKDFDDNFMLYLLEYLNLNQHANQNAQPVISGSKIYPIVIAFPSYDEQVKIGNSIKDIDIIIKLYIEEKEDFISLKKVLMEELLTGKIRVNTLQVEA